MFYPGSSSSKRKRLPYLTAQILVVGFNYFAVQVLTAVQVSTHTTLTVSVIGVSVGTATLSQEVKTKANNAITTKVKIDFFILQIYSIKNAKAKNKSWLFTIK